MKRTINRIFIVFSLLFILIFSLGIVSAGDDSTNPNFEIQDSIYQENNPSNSNMDMYNNDFVCDLSDDEDICTDDFVCDLSDDEDIGEVTRNQPSTDSLRDVYGSSGTSINLDNYTINNNTINLSVSLSSNDNVLPGNITITLFNISYKVLNKTSFTFDYILPDEGGIYYGTLQYSGPKNIYSEKSFNVSVPYRKQTFIDIDPIFYMELGSKNYRINFTVKDEDGNLVKGEETIFGNYLNMELKTFYNSIQKIGVLESKLSWGIDSPNYIGNYSCFIHYVSDKYTFLDSYAYFNIIVYNKVNMTMDYRNITYGEDAYFIFNFNVDNGETVLGIVDLSLINKDNNFNKTYVVPISQDIQRINREIIISSLDAGTYDVFAKYRGNDYFESVNVSSQLIVSKLKTSIIASNMKTYNTDIKVDGKIGKYFKLRLLDQKNNPLSNRKVKITINNITYTLTTNSGGNASLQINIKKLGNYSCSISFPNEENYFGSSKIIKITIVKRPIPTKVKIKAKYSSIVGKKIKLKATVKDKFGKKMNKGKVGFYVGGKVYTAKVKKGVATVTINCPSATLVKRVKKTVGNKIKTTYYYSSTYYCTVEYRGYKYYAKNSTNFKIVSKYKDVVYKKAKKSSKSGTTVTYGKKVSKAFSFKIPLNYAWVDVYVYTGSKYNKYFTQTNCLGFGSVQIYEKRGLHKYKFRAHPFSSSSPLYKENGEIIVK